MPYWKASCSYFHSRRYLYEPDNTDAARKQTVQIEIFAMLYSDRKDLLDLYNAVSGKHYEDPELLEINTLEMQSTCRCIMICPFSLIPDFPCMSISPPTVLTCPAVFVLYLGSVFRDDKR